jgi:outer membrane protein OmpA-like peptidoglycan-associated protein
MTTRRLLALAAVPLLLAACETPTTAQPQRFVVFFTEDSAALNENGEQVVNNAATAAKAAASARIAVLGYAGPDGSVAFNRALSDARARHVADHLIQQGIPSSRIDIRPRGPVPFDLAPTESRRVEIVIGG